MLEKIIKDEISKFKIEENDRHYEDLIFSMPLNESISWNDITGYVSKIVNKRSVLQKAINKFNMSKNKSMKKYLLMIIFTLITLGSTKSISDTAENDMIDKLHKFELEQLAIQQAERDSINQAEAVEIMKEFKKIKIKNMSISENGKEFIKRHESYRDKAYKLGDGMVTIGYGHAERISKSQFKVGEKISRSQAEAFFNEDVKRAEDGVKRILLSIFEEGGNINVNQNMFDALVSMAYNMGVRGLATTEFIKAFAKSENPLQAAELIKNSRVGRWKGLKKRRQQEYELFVSDPIDAKSIS